MLEQGIHHLVVLGEHVDDVDLAHDPPRQPLADFSRSSRLRGIGSPCCPNLSMINTSRYPYVLATHRSPAVREDTQHAADLLRALANPHRVAIVGELATGEQCVHELVDAVGISQPLLSQHLRTLRAARLVEGQRRGREIAYSLSDDHVAHIVRDAVLHGSERNRG